MNILRSSLLLAALLLSSPGLAADGLTDAVVAGYQGWYGCPGDYAGNTQWQYWFPKDVSPAGFISDLLPSVRALDAGHLCDTGIARADGQGTIKLYSAQDPAVVAQHFAWMKEAGIDAAAVQRFLFALPDAGKKARMDHLLANVMAAAPASGRSFFIVYDITGANPKTVMDDVRRDWHHLVDDLGITKAPGYLHDHGKPVLELWGFGIGDRPGEAADVQSLVNDLKSGTGGLRSVTLVGGVPTYWRTLTHDSKTDPRWAAVYRSFDVISPWTVGRYATDADYATYARDLEGPDATEAHRAGARYLPVVFPGYSHANAARFHGKALAFNTVPRHCGRFYWQQFAGASAVHADGVYVAMFDEVGEGTAIFPLETRADKTMAGGTVVVVNQDGCSLPDDWYLRVTAAAAGLFTHGKPFPMKLEQAVHP